jgi:hypothetical protein
LIAFVGGYFLIPKAVFADQYAVGLSALFLFSFALTITCLIRNIKERVAQAQIYKSSLIGIIATAIGISALQACGIGAPICGASIGTGIISMLFPGFLFTYLHVYGVPIIVVSIISQLISLYFMNCFKRSNNK